MVQVGGHNVSPGWVASKLPSQLAVKLAVVRLNADASPGLKAFVVLHEAGQLSHQGKVEVWALSGLPGHVCPTTFTYGVRLPTNAMGKPADWLVA
jgi:long-chain acyl-CoA synthetase